MADFPTSVTTNSDPTGGSLVTNPDHALEHQSHNAEIKATQTKLGTGSSTPVANTLLKGTGTGTSSWGTLTSAVLAATVTDETGSGSLVFANTPTLVTPVLGVATGTSLALNGGTALGTTNQTGTGNLVLASSPTIVTPTIASFTNAQHNHSNAAGGGVLPANTVGISRLAAIESTDLFNGTGITAATWTDFKANQNFTVDNSSSVILISITGNAQITSTTTITNVASRIIIDSAGTPITRYTGGGNSNAANQAVNPFAGSGFIIVTGLSAGTHTIKTQVYSVSANSIIYCRTSTQPNIEFFSTYVMELKV